MMDPQDIPKICSTCRKVKVCKMYEAMSLTIQTWNARFADQIKFPMDADAIAKVCSEYESPRDVIVTKTESVPTDTVDITKLEWKEIGRTPITDVQERH